MEISGRRVLGTTQGQGRGGSYYRTESLMADGVAGKKLDNDSQVDQFEGATNVTKDVLTNFVKETTNNGSWTISADPPF